MKRNAEKEVSSKAKKPKAKKVSDEDSGYLNWYNNLTKEDKKGYKKMYTDAMGRTLTYRQMYDRMINRFGLILTPPNRRDK